MGHQKKIKISIGLTKTSSGAGCICDYKNTKSPPYTLYTLEWCTLSGYMVYTFKNSLKKKHLSLLLNINIRDMNETCKKHNYISPLTYVYNLK